MREGWKQTRIADLVEPIMTIDPRKRPDGIFTYIDVSSISRETFEIVETTQLKGADAPSRARRLVKQGDIIFATIRPTLQRIAEVPKALDGAVCSTGYFVLRPKPKVLTKFLFYSLFTPEFFDAMAELQRGAAYPAVSDADVRDQKLSVPPIPEQKRIVAILDEAFVGIATAVANTEKNLANARQLFESYLKSVFNQRGEGWEDKRLSEVCTLSSGGTPSKKEASYWNGDIPWVSGRDMKSTRLSDSALHVSEAAIKESSTRMAPAGTILVLVRGMGLAHGAQLAELIAPCAFNQDIRGVHPNANMVPRYLLFALRDRINSSDRVLRSAAHGTLKLDSTELVKLVIPVPPVSQQEQIVADVDRIAEESLHLKTIYQQKLNALSELKQSLLQKAFSGELTAAPQQDLETALA